MSCSQHVSILRVWHVIKCKWRAKKLRLKTAGPPGAKLQTKNNVELIRVPRPRDVVVHVARVGNHERQHHFWVSGALCPAVGPAVAAVTGPSVLTNTEPTLPLASSITASRTAAGLG